MCDWEDYAATFYSQSAYQASFVAYIYSYNFNCKMRTWSNSLEKSAV